MRWNIVQARAESTRQAIIELITFLSKTPITFAKHFDTTREPGSKHLKILTA
jgi:hypothetical protein